MEKDYGIPGFSKMTARERIEAIKANMTPEQLEDFDKTSKILDGILGIIPSAEQRANLDKILKHNQK